MENVPSVPCFPLSKGGAFIVKSDDGDSPYSKPAMLGADVWQIIDSVPAFVWCASPDGSIQFLNQRGLAYTGFSLGQIRGWNWKDTNILHPDDMQGLFETWSAIVASGRESEIQARMKRFDGEYRWFLFRVAPLKDHSGQLVGWLGIDVEIDERKRSEDQLQQSQLRLAEALDEIKTSEAQLRTIIDTIPTLVWSALPDGSVDFLSHRWLEYYGLSLQDAKEWGWSDLVHPEHLDGIVNRWRAFVTSGEPYEHEVRARTVDGKYRWTLSRAVPLRDQQGSRPQPQLAPSELPATIAKSAPLFSMICALFFPR